MSKKIISTLEFYNYGENYKMVPDKEALYKVKVSDKDGNIITIEKNNSLYACVKLDFDTNSGVLRLIDVAHEDSVLAEVEMTNADYIYNCRFDEELNAILFDVKSLYGNETSTIELDVESLIELYEAGSGIEIGEKNPETGRKPISIKLADGEELLQLTDSGLGLDGKVITEEELAAAISGKADIEYVDSIISGISAVTEIVDLVERHDEEIEKLKRIVGTDEEIPSLFEQIDSNREDIAELDEELGELSGAIDTVIENTEAISGKVDSISDDVYSLSDALDDEINRAKAAEIDLDTEIIAEENARKEGSVASVNYDSSGKTINFFNFNNELIDSIDATDFVKDGMIDSVYLETVSGTTYLVIVWNTDSGKETIRINLGDLFNADDYYTKEEVDAKVSELIAVDNQQWAAINQNREDLEEVDRQLWGAINDEIENREHADSALSDRINNEAETRLSADTLLSDAIQQEVRNRENAIEGVEDEIDEERSRAELAESSLTVAIENEKQRAAGEEHRIESKFDNAVEDLEREDSNLRQYINDKDSATNNRIDSLSAGLSAETLARQEADNELSDSVNEIKETYATKEYVDTKDEEIKETAISTSILSSKTYTDSELDALETSLKEYCDEEHDELRRAISDNSTDINVISNLKGVSGSDISNYDDSGNGILDVLHREFHEFEQNYGSIKDIKVVDGNLVITYYTKTGEKESVIPLTDIVDLSDYYTKEEADAAIQEAISTINLENYYTKEETDEQINNAVEHIVLDNYYTKEETDELVGGKLDSSAFTDVIEDIIDGASSDYNTFGKVEEKIKENKSELSEIVQLLGYTNNDTLETNNDNEAAFGTYNISHTGETDADKTIFSVGNGTSDEDRSNAIDIRKDGTVYMLIEGEMMNINELLAMLAHEVY